MTIQKTVVSTAITLLSLKLYSYRSPKFPLSQTIGIALAAIFHGSRAYSEPFLKNWVEEKHLDIVYTATTFALMSGTAAYGGAPTKTNLLTSMFFSGIQFGSHRFVSSFDKQTLPPSSITQEKLSEYRSNSYESGSYLTDQLFPTSCEYPPTSATYSAYLYLAPEGFMVVLCSNGNHPFFMHLPTVDGTEVKRMRRMERLTLPVSEDLHRYIEQLARKVEVTHLDHSVGNKEWTLNGIPPFICIEGRWNRIPESHGVEIDWDALIQSDLTQKHDAFSLHLIHPKWQHIPQNPNMRGMSYQHSQIGFELWVHEPNTNALPRAQEATQKKIKHLQNVVQFIKDFEEAAFTFSTTNDLPRTRKGNSLDLLTLEKWGNLAKQIPFSIENNPYETLPDMVKAFRKKKDQTPEKEKALIEMFRGFFQNLPWEAHFGSDYSLYEQFHEAFELFKQHQDLVKTERGYIDTKSLQKWLNLLEKTEYYCGATQELQELIQTTKQYLNGNNQLRNTQQEELKARLRGDLNNLSSLLKEGFKTFFMRNQREILSRGQFVRDLKREIRSLEEKKSLAPRSHSESTAQIQFEVDASEKDLLLTLRNNRAQQVSLLLNLIDRSFLSPQGDFQLEVACFQKIQDFHQRAIDFMKRKAQGYKIEQNPLWVVEGDRSLIEQEDTPRLSDGSEYDDLRVCNKNSAKEATYHLREMRNALANLYSAVNQLNRDSYVTSPLLREEVELMNDFYKVVNELLKALNIPMDFNSHERVHKQSKEIKRVKDALNDPKSYFIYKRIGNQGSTQVEILKRGETGELATLNDFHNSIYYHL